MRSIREPGAIAEYLRFLAGLADERRALAFLQAEDLAPVDAELARLLDLLRADGGHGALIDALAAARASTLAPLPGARRGLLASLGLVALLGPRLGFIARLREADASDRRKQALAHLRQDLLALAEQQPR